MVHRIPPPHFFWAQKLVVSEGPKRFRVYGCGFGFRVESSELEDLSEPF